MSDHLLQPETPADTIRIDVCITPRDWETFRPAMGLPEGPLPAEGTTLRLPGARPVPIGRALQLWRRLIRVLLWLWDPDRDSTDHHETPALETEQAMTKPADQPDATEADSVLPPDRTVHCAIELDLVRMRAIHATACDPEAEAEERQQALSALLSTYPAVLTSLALSADRSTSLEQQLLELRHSRYEQASHRSSN